MLTISDEQRYYCALRQDLQHAGKYLNRENLALLAKKKPIFLEIEEDIDAVEEILGLTLEPQKPHNVLHRNLTSTIYQRLVSGGKFSKEHMEADIVEAGKIRRSLG